MAITYPLALPSYEVVASEFDIPEFGFLSRSGSGHVAFQELVGGDLWQWKLAFRPLYPDEFAVMEAWKGALRRNGTFKAIDPLYRYPQNYGAAVLNMTKAAGGAFTGAISVVAAGGTQIDISGLPVSFVVKAGDRLSFSWLGRQTLVRILENYTGDVDGTLENIEIEPWLLAGGSVPVAGTIVDPWCAMKVIPRTWQAPRSELLSPVSFEAIQA